MGYLEDFRRQGQRPKIAADNAAKRAYGETGIPASDVLDRFRKGERRKLDPKRNKADKDIMLSILKEAKGNKDLALEIAKERGFFF